PRGKPPESSHLDVGWLLAGHGPSGRNRWNRHLALAVAPARLRRLEGPACMKFAIRQPCHLALAAEMEVRGLWIADRPATAAIGQRLDRAPLLERDDKLFHR